MTKILGLDLRELMCILGVLLITFITMIGMSGCSYEIDTTGDDENPVLEFTDAEVRQHRDFIRIGLGTAYGVWATRPVTAMAHDNAYRDAVTGYSQALWAHGRLVDGVGTTEADVIWILQDQIAMRPYDDDTVALIQQHVAFYHDLVTTMED